MVREPIWYIIYILQLCKSKYCTHCAVEINLIIVLSLVNGIKIYFTHKRKLYNTVIYILYIWILEERYIKCELYKMKSRILNFWAQFYSLAVTAISKIVVLINRTRSSLFISVKLGKRIFILSHPNRKKKKYSQRLFLFIAHIFCFS